MNHVLPTPSEPTLDPEADPVVRGVLRMVLYFDVFKHPLSLGELERLVAPGERARVEQACEALVEQRLLAAEGRYRFVPGQSRQLGRRRSRAEHAERAWPSARRAAAVLAQLPFVRGVLITGGMSKNSTDPDGDVDFLLLVQPGRVWTLKTLLQGGRRALPYPLRELFCTNYLLDTDHLRVDDRNLFTAIELATAIPMWGREACVSLLEANAWASAYVPGLDWSVERARCVPEGPARRIGRVVETAWIDAAAERVERGAMDGWSAYWDRKYDWLDGQTRSQRFKRREEIATNHLHDFQSYVLREVRQRMEQAGLDEPLADTPVALLRP